MKTSKGMILNSQSKLQSDSQFVLIDIDDKNSTKLIESVDQNLVFIDAVSKQTNWIKSSLDQLGLAPGCYLISDLRDQTDINVTNLINGFSPIRQYGYQVGIIADINQLPNLDDLIKNQVYLINSGKSNQKQDALLQNNEIDDYSGKLSKGMSVAWQRDYTNVNVSVNHPGYVGMGQDTLLKGGNGFGYSTNGKDFNTVISPKGIIFRRPDAERMWRLLKPKQRDDIDQMVGSSVAKEVALQNEALSSANASANEAVQRANQAVEQSTTNSNAIININSAVSAAKSDADAALKTVSANSTAISQNQAAINLKADQATVDQLNNSVKSQAASLTVMNSAISTKVTSADVEQAIDSKGYVNKDFVESSITQSANQINESITDLKGNVQNVTADVHGLQTTVENKADQSQITQLNNVIQSKVSSDDFNNLSKTVELQTLDSADINTMKTNGHYFVHNLANTPIQGWVYVDVMGNGNDRIRQDVYQDLGNQHCYRRWWGNSWTDWSKSTTESEITQLSDDINLRVKSADLISQINLQAGNTLIQSGKIYLDAASVVFSGKAFIPDAAITNLSLDKLSTGNLTIPLQDENGNQISLDQSGINIASAMKNVQWVPNLSSSNDMSGFDLNLSSQGIKFTNHWQYADKSKGTNDYDFINIQPDVLHERDGSTDSVNIPSGLTMYVPTQYSNILGPDSPGGFFALGYEVSGSGSGDSNSKGVEIAYVTRSFNGWETGLHINTSLFTKPVGADHGIRTAWVSWSNWDGGERYPALVQDGPNWGGVAFPKSGRVTLFDANGRYYTPDKSTGMGLYNNYGG